jgi:signal transduction histidine kinase
MAPRQKPRVTLRIKIFLPFVLLTLGVVALVMIFVSRRFTEEMRQNLISSLEGAAQQYQTFNDINIRRLQDQAVSMSVDVRLQASLTTMDPGTISQTVQEMNRIQPSDMLAALSASGEFLAAQGFPPDFQIEFVSQPAVIDAMNGYDSADIWTVADDLMSVATIPIVAAEKQIGVLLLGEVMDQPFLDELRQMTDMHATLWVVDHIPYSTYYAGSREETEKVFAPLAGRKGVWDFTMLHETFIGTCVPIVDVQQRRLGDLFLYNSLDKALASLIPLRWSMFFIAVIGAALSLLFSYILARSVTKPVMNLSEAIRSFGIGQYDTPVEIQSNDEVGGLADAFEDMRRSMLKAQEELLKNERLSTVGSMANGIIHDFKQPITVIQGFSDLLTQRATNEEKRREYAQQIHLAIQQMMGMINDVLEFARGRTTLVLENLDLNTIITPAVQQLHASLSESNIELTFIPGEIGTAPLDRSRIQRVVENLIGNARDAITSSGQITLETRRNDGGIELTIQDTGTGIPEQIRENLFDPFVTAGKRTGTGLGLAISKNIVEEHGGNITFTTKEDEGTTFHVWLPEE